MGHCPFEGSFIPFLKPLSGCVNTHPKVRNVSKFSGMHICRVLLPRIWIFELFVFTTERICVFRVKGFGKAKGSPGGPMHNLGNVIFYCYNYITCYVSNAYHHFKQMDLLWINYIEYSSIDRDITYILK